MGFWGGDGGFEGGRPWGLRFNGISFPPPPLSLFLLLLLLLLSLPPMHRVTYLYYFDVNVYVSDIFFPVLDTRTFSFSLDFFSPLLFLVPFKLPVNPRPTDVRRRRRRRRRRLSILWKIVGAGPGRLKENEKKKKQKNTK